jgi:hypothetical protein
MLSRIQAVAGFHTQCRFGQNSAETHVTHVCCWIAEWPCGCWRITAHHSITSRALTAQGCGIRAGLHNKQTTANSHALFRLVWCKAKDVGIRGILQVTLAQPTCVRFIKTCKRIRSYDSQIFAFGCKLYMHNAEVTLNFAYSLRQGQISLQLHSDRRTLQLLTDPSTEMSSLKSCCSAGTSLICCTRLEYFPLRRSCSLLSGSLHRGLFLTWA